MATQLNVSEFLLLLAAGGLVLIVMLCIELAWFFITRRRP
jgi:hypothetical protein